MCISDDWEGTFGNPAKLGLGLMAILVDIIFLTQHYVLYGPKPRKGPAPDAKHLVIQRKAIPISAASPLVGSDRQCQPKIIF